MLSMGASMGVSLKKILLPFLLRAVGGGNRVFLYLTRNPFHAKWLQ